jgi:hypothetical protein
VFSRGEALDARLLQGLLTALTEARWQLDDVGPKMREGTASRLLRAPLRRVLLPLLQHLLREGPPAVAQQSAAVDLVGQHGRHPPWCLIGPLARGAAGRA